jgi:hypothetical protein
MFAKGKYEIRLGWGRSKKAPVRLFLFLHILLKKFVALQFLLRQSFFRTLGIFNTHVTKNITVSKFPVTASTF